jgi:hypothetical protein
MSTYEIEAQVGPDGAITLRSLPFAEGQHVRIQIEPAGKPISSVPRAFGLHSGAVWMSDDFDEPLPDSFWLGEAVGDEPSD